MGVSKPPAGACYLCAWHPPTPMKSGTRPTPLFRRLQLLLFFALALGCGYGAALMTTQPSVRGFVPAAQLGPATPLAPAEHRLDANEVASR